MTSGYSCRYTDCDSPELIQRGRSAFTLVELAIVILILSLLAAGALRYTTILKDMENLTKLNSSLDAVELALFNYRSVYGRLPCPADITLAENDVTGNFGKEIETLQDGLCTGANFQNGIASTDPDHSDPLYDSTTAQQVVAGAIPVKTLGLPNKYAYDAWGRKILYAVDKRITINGGFSTYPINNSVIGAIVVKSAATDALVSALTYKAVYALVSHGKNGHGAYVRNMSAASVRFNSGSTNTDELKNCHCDNSATATAFDRIFVENKSNLTNGGSLSVKFDDITRFKTRQQIGAASELQ